MYYNVQPNPTVQVVNDCIAAARTLQVQLLVALGGGSAIDTAKATSIVVACGGTVEQYEGENKSSKPGLPIVAVNTTARHRQRVHLLLHRHRSCPPQQNGHGGPQLHGQHCGERHRLHVLHAAQAHRSHRHDALTHAIEAALSRNANPLTDKDAYWAMHAIVQNLPRAVANGQMKPPVP